MFFLLHLFISSIFPLDSRHLIYTNLHHQLFIAQVQRSLAANFGLQGVAAMPWSHPPSVSAPCPPSVRFRAQTDSCWLRLEEYHGGTNQKSSSRARRDIFGDYHRTWSCMLVQTVMVFADKPGKLRGPHLKSHQIISCATSLQLHISFI